jgi:hypothetical protein
MNAALRQQQAVKSEADSDEIMEVDSLISLHCPLSVGRIENAARGVNCEHRRCFDLNTFLGLSDYSGNWQCPICQVPVGFSDIRTDNRMNAILAETHEDVIQIRMKPDGSYTPIDEEAQQARRKRRRLRRETAAPSHQTKLVPALPNNTGPHASKPTQPPVINPSSVLVALSSHNASSSGSSMDDAIVLD